MKLGYEPKTRQFVFKCLAQEKDIAIRNGFFWDSNWKIWRTRNPQNARKLEQYATPRIRKIIGEEIYRFHYEPRNYAVH